MLSFVKSKLGNIVMDLSQSFLFVAGIDDRHDSRRIEVGLIGDVFAMESAAPATRPTHRAVA